MAVASNVFPILFSLALLFTGCCLNGIVYEKLVKADPEYSVHFTATQFIVVLTQVL